MKWYYLFPITFAALIPLVIAGMVFYQKLREKNSFLGKTGKKKSKQKTASLRDFWQIKAIESDGLVIIHPGRRYRLICRVAAQDFYLLSEAEQNNVEDALAATLIGLSFPIQSLVTAETLDTRSAVAALREKAPALHPKVAEHALARAEYLEALMEDRAVAARFAYIVVPFDTDKGIDHAKGELYARLASLMNGLLPARVRLEPLDVNGVCDLLAHILNRGRAWRPSAAGEKGVMASFHISEKEVLKNV